MDELQELLYAFVQNLVVEITQEVAEKSNIPIAEGGVMPVKTGRLRSSMQLTQEGGNSMSITYNTPYASIIHDGGTDRMGRRYRAQKYLSIPVQEILDDLPDRIEESMEKFGRTLPHMKVNIEPVGIL